MRNSILIVGHSHSLSLEEGWKSKPSDDTGFEFHFVNLTAPPLRSSPKSRSVKNSQKHIEREMALQLGKADRWLTVLLIRGNEHNQRSFRGPVPADWEKPEREVYEAVLNWQQSWFEELRPLLPGPLVLQLTTPPLGPAEWIMMHRPKHPRYLDDEAVANDRFRLALWAAQCRAMKDFASKIGVPLLPVPTPAVSETGFLAEEFRGIDATHGNANYGRLVVSGILEHAKTLSRSPSSGAQPYSNLPAPAFWKQRHQPELIHPTPLTISRADRLLALGSCFSDHISARLKARGYQVENGHAGNIYTPRQLLQLHERAFNALVPIERVWKRPDGKYVSCFRPRFEYATADAVIEQEQRHLVCVRQLFRTTEVFLFTLGGTEAWCHRTDGAIYPMVPGLVAGDYDPDRYTFISFSIEEVLSDLRSFLRKLRAHNPRARIVFTVSPIPMAATYTSSHVVVANTRSKALLRAACDQITREDHLTAYFPAYEIIMSGGPKFFEADRRKVTDEGIAEVMSTFMRRWTYESEETRDEREKSIPCDDDLLLPGGRLSEWKARFFSILHSIGPPRRWA